MIDLVFVGDRCCDHSPSSGYDQICSLFPEAGWLSGRALEAGEVTWHRRPLDAARSSSRLFHVFYGDCSGSAAPALVRERFPDATVVSTLHQPVSRMIRDEAATAALPYVDAVVTVSEAQARDLERLDLDVPVYTVPHGVWTAPFRRARAVDRVRRDVLLVGTYLRDWEGASRVVSLLAEAGVRSVVVGANEHGDRFADRELVRVSPRLAEPELARVYDESAALFLPVLEATASNAVLEAMATGCPVVHTRSPSLEEYLGDGADSFDAGADGAAVARLLDYVTHPRLRAARSRALVRQARRFDWARLKARYRETYREVTRARPSAARSTSASAGSLRRR